MTFAVESHRWRTDRCPFTFSERLKRISPDINRRNGAKEARRDISNRWGRSPTSANSRRSSREDEEGWHHRRVALPGDGYRRTHVHVGHLAVSAFRLSSGFPRELVAEVLASPTCLAHLAAENLFP